MSNNVQVQDVMTAFAISDFYQMLSISLRLPNHELAEAMLDGSYGQDAVNILEELSCSQEDIAKMREALNALISAEEDATTLLIRMRREYTRLFDDPKKPALSIYETLFLHNPEEANGGVMLFMSPAALDAERCYREAGVRVVKQSAEPADHMATELEFMMYLYARKGKALQEQNAEEITRIEKQIKGFEELHLKKWGQEFFEMLRTETNEATYLAVAQLALLGLTKIIQV
ncbi:molecular chaperone [Desulfitobacterium sp. PCE1]|uniref:TorD/DmsD family molecular chaperone n=1 Tax=Desulfitobacterium sp. PCE1 TaxID=146907 RepID=UPI00036BAD2E|nr:molecular chaperone TorD family protein [Desulfitobacterium sp. PCE1]